MCVCVIVYHVGDVDFHKYDDELEDEDSNDEEHLLDEEQPFCNSFSMREAF